LYYRTENSKTLFKTKDTTTIPHIYYNIRRFFGFENRLYFHFPSYYSST